MDSERAGMLRSLLVEDLLGRARFVVSPSRFGRASPRGLSDRELDR